jgi:hypothetical protein
MLLLQGVNIFTISAAPLYPGRGCRYFHRRWRFSDKVRANSWELCDLAAVMDL